MKLLGHPLQLLYCIQNPDGCLVFYLVFYSGGSIAVVTSGGAILSNLSVTGSNGNKLTGLISAYGNISYQITSAVAGTSTSTVTITFTTALPAGFSVYKVDKAANYSLIPQTTGSDGFWVQNNANSISITLKDGGIFDLDGVANGSISDPIAVFAAATAIPTLSFWGLLLMITLLSVFGIKKTTTLKS